MELLVTKEKIAATPANASHATETLAAAGAKIFRMGNRRRATWSWRSLSTTGYRAGSIARISLIRASITPEPLLAGMRGSERCAAWILPAGKPDARDPAPHPS